MTKLFLVACAFFLLPFAKDPVHADESRGEVSKLVYYAETPPGSLLSVSIANVDPGTPGTRTKCESAAATFNIFGTVASVPRDNDAVGGLRLRHQSRLRLSPGQVQRFEFLQAGDTSETVIFTTAMSGGAAQCLVHSNVTVQSAAGDLVSVVPPPAADPIVKYYLAKNDLTTVPYLCCCPCAPLCDCGNCLC